MRTVTFKSVLDGSALRMGLSPDENVQANTASALAEYITSAVREFWEMDGWWPWVLVQARNFRDAYDAGTAYAEGDEVWYAAEEKYYSALGATTGNLPTDVTYWEEATDLVPYLDFEQTGKTKFGELLGVWGSNPYENRGATSYNFWLNGNVAYVDGTAPTTVYAEFTARPPEFKYNIYATGTAYVAGDVVYLEETGECYAALGATTGNAPTDTTYWEKQDMPYLLAEVVKLTAAAEGLREDGQFAKAAVLEGKARTKLDAECDKILFKQGQIRRISVASR